MTTKKKTTTGKGSAKKLKLHKETLKDLSVRSKAVKGGRPNSATNSACMISCAQECCGMSRSCSEYHPGYCSH